MACADAATPRHASSRLQLLALILLILLLLSLPAKKPGVCPVPDCKGVLGGKLGARPSTPGRLSAVWPALAGAARERRAQRLTRAPPQCWTTAACAAASTKTRAATACASAEGRWTRLAGAAWPATEAATACASPAPAPAPTPPPRRCRRRRRRAPATPRRARARSGQQRRRMRSSSSSTGSTGNVRATRSPASVAPLRCAPCLHCAAALC